MATLLVYVVSTVSGRPGWSACRFFDHRTGLVSPARTRKLRAFLAPPPETLLPDDDDAVTGR
jgi:hypothetical protein